ncbi:MAG: glycosyltransferase family 39 protein [Candidatus Promineifilaceae bacterium]
MTTRRKWLDNLLLAAAVFLLLALPRWLISAQYATADETKWVARAANFAYALYHGSLADTYQSEHPGVTVMWAGAAGLTALFPGYASAAPGPLEPYELDQFLQQQGYTPLQALVAGRKVMIALNALALTLLFFYARRLLGHTAAILAAAFMAFSPFLIAHTQLMHLDGLAGSLMLLSLLAFLAYAADRRVLDLLLAGIVAGLAWLTKTPAFILGPILLVIALLLARRQAARPVLTAYLLWAVIGAITFLLFWPVMWSSPISTMQRILAGALSYAGGGHADPVFFNGIIYDDGRIPAQIFSFYPLTYLWRSTPVIVIGLVLLAPALWRRWPPLDQARPRGATSILLLYALLFTLFMTLGDKKFDRYLLPIYPTLQLVAAVAWTALIQTAARRWFDGRVSRLAAGLLLGLVAVWQLVSLQRVFPYPLSYYNPLLGGSARAPQVMQIGWGEGLDAAGRYLSQKPDSSDLVVAGWYRSALAYYFDGQTLSINAEMSPEEVAAVEAADYAVLYIHQWQRGVPPALLAKFADRQPEEVIEINGLEYARIYAASRR